MPIRCVINPIHNLARALFRGLGLALIVLTPTLGLTQSGDAVELDLNQARQLAVYALQTNDPGLAIQVSKGLLQADPRDPLAYYVIATAHSQLNQPRLGRMAAARAYRYADSGPAQFRAAQLAAQMAFAENRPTLTQIWLRRTAIHAPTERDEQLVARDYRALRTINPWSFRLRTDLRPSNNVNNGADTALLIIDGQPDVGGISRRGQALSGITGSLDIATSYRLRADEHSRTSIGGRLYMQRVALSGASKDLLAGGPVIPGRKPVRNSDFASTYAELTLRHGFALGESGGSASVEAAFGESWYAQERSYRFGRVRAERKWRLGKGRTGLTLNAMGETRTKARYLQNDANIFGLGAKVEHQLGNGDKLDLTIALRDTNARMKNGTFSSASMRTSYAFAKPVGPARLSAGLVLGYSEYPDFIYSLFIPSSQREDKSVYGDLSMFFYRYDYAGFAPMLRIRTGRKVSNFSPFSAREFSVSLSVQSKF